MQSDFVLDFRFVTTMWYGLHFSEQLGIRR